MTTTPAAQLKQAADKLREVAPDITGPLAGLADPVADWLEHAARRYEASVIAATQVWGDAGHAEAVAFVETGPGSETHALAVARALLGEVSR